MLKVSGSWCQLKAGDGGVLCVDLWLEGACQGLGNHYQILGLKLGLTLTLAITHPQDTEHES